MIFKIDFVCPLISALDDVIDLFPSPCIEVYRFDF